MMYNNTQRNFIIGDSWLYYKIYTGSKTSDTILTEIIKPITNKLLKDKIIDKWFFIRYADPKHHIRVRFHYDNPEYIGHIINALYSAFKTFIDQDLIWKMQIDTYQREIERYGSNTIDIGETLFYYDSKMIVNFLDLIEGDDGGKLRWLFSIRAIDSLLNSFKYKIEEKKNLLEDLSIGFKNEFGATKHLRKQLNDKYRKEGDKLQNFMALTIENNQGYLIILELLKEKEIDIEDIDITILNHHNKGSLELNLNNLMSSYIHMLMNRIFKSKNRLHEMVCYDFLYRYYKSMIARGMVF